MTDEIWRNVEGYESYQVSNLGNVRSLNYHMTGRTQVLSPGKNRGGYMTVGLYKDGKRKRYRVHRLVATAFLENKDSNLEVEHKNCIRHDNRVENLRLCSHRENCNNEITLKNYSEAKKGKPKSEETKRKLSESNGKTVYMICKETGEILNVFKSAVEAERITGISNARISNCCSGKRKSAGGYRWEHSIK